MDPGKRDKRIEIQAPGGSRGPTGEVLTTWTTVATRWANIRPLTGREYMLAQQMQAAGTLMVNLRYDAWPTLTPRHRFKYGTRILEINELVNVNERGVEWQARCSEAE